MTSLIVADLPAAQAVVLLLVAQSPKLLSQALLAEALGITEVETSYRLVELKRCGFLTSIDNIHFQLDETGKQVYHLALRYSTSGLDAKTMAEVPLKESAEAFSKRIAWLIRALKAMSEQCLGLSQTCALLALELEPGQNSCQLSKYTGFEPDTNMKLIAFMAMVHQISGLQTEALTPFVKLKLSTEGLHQANLILGLPETSLL